LNIFKMPFTKEFWKERREEICKKMSIAQKKNPVKYWEGKSRSEATKEKIRQSLLGRKSSSEANIKRSLTLKGRESEKKGKNFKDIIGKEREEERRKMISDKIVKQYLSGQRKNKMHYKQAYYKGTRMRSSWEKEVAKKFDSMNIKWVYEPKRFFLDGCTYLPDFYLPESNNYVEVKGYWNRNKKDIKKVSDFSKEHDLVIIDSANYEHFLKTGNITESKYVTENMSM